VGVRLPFVVCLGIAVASLPATVAAQGFDPVVRVSVAPGREFLPGEYFQLDVKVTPPADAAEGVQVLVDGLGTMEGFVRRLDRSSTDCPDGVGCGAPCPPGRLCFTAPLRLDWRSTPGRLTLPITISDARGRQTRTAASVDVRPSGDRDGDGLPDAFEDYYRLTDRDDGGPADDANGNGVNNLDEFRRGTNPRARFTRFFAEASTGDRAPGVETCFEAAALRDPGFPLKYSWYTLIGDDGRRLENTFAIKNFSFPRCLLGRALFPADRVVGAIVESEVPFAVDRVVATSDAAAVPFATPAMDGPSTRWYFADGGTDGVLDTFYLAYNPGTAPVEAEIVYRRPDGAVARRRRLVLAPGVRTTTWVDADDAPLGRTAAWVEITAAAPILVERAWRFDPPGRTVTQPYASAGTSDPSSRWIFPDADGQAAFDTTFHLANPDTREAVVDVSLLFADREERKAGQVRVPPGGRISLPARAILSDGRASVEFVSVNGVRVAAERTASGQDAHGAWRLATVGARASAERWTLPHVDLGYDLVVTNVSNVPARVELHFSAPSNFDNDIVTSIQVPARGRVVYPLQHVGGGQGQRGTLRVSSLDTDRGRAELVVEAVRYADVEGVARARSSGVIGAIVP